MSFLLTCPNCGAEVRIRKGDRVHAHLVPRVVETVTGPIEAADLCFEDGSVAQEVPFEWFRFVE